MFNQILIADEELAVYIILSIIGGILLIAGYTWIVFKMIEIAKEKGYEDKISDIGWMFFLCSIIGLGIIPFTYVIALPNKKLVRTNERIRLLLEEIKGDKTSSIQDDSLPEL